MTQEMEWPGSWTRAIGAAVRAARKRAGNMSAAELSRRCAALGVDIPRNTIANLENGRKSTIPLHELAALAAALRVPPIELIASIGQVEELEVLPGFSDEPWALAQWIVGDLALARRPDGSPTWDDEPPPSIAEAWRVYYGTVDVWYRDLDRLDEAEAAIRDMDAGEKTMEEWLGGQPRDRQYWEIRRQGAANRLRSAKKQLLSLRAWMNENGQTLPLLPLGVERFDVSQAEAGRGPLAAYPFSRFYQHEVAPDAQ